MGKLDLIVIKHEAPQKNTANSVECCEHQTLPTKTYPLRVPMYKAAAVTEAQNYCQHIIHMPHCSIQTITPLYPKVKDCQHQRLFSNGVEIKPISVLVTNLSNAASMHTTGSVQKPTPETLLPSLCRVTGCNNLTARRSLHCTKHRGVRRC